jgi:hypothetical protein
MIDGNVDLLDPTGMNRTYNASLIADIVERHKAHARLLS